MTIRCLSMRMSTTQVLCPNREAVGFFVMTGFHILMTLSLLPVTRSLSERSRWKHLTPCKSKNITNTKYLCFMYQPYFHPATKIYFLTLTHWAITQHNTLIKTKDMRILAIINKVARYTQLIVGSAIR